MTAIALTAAMLPTIATTALTLTVIVLLTVGLAMSVWYMCIGVSVSVSACRQ